MSREGGNLNYVDLLAGASAADFLRMRDTDALGADPIEAYVASARTTADVFAQLGAFAKLLDYALGKIDARQGIAIRTNSAIHTWDLARALGVDGTLGPRLVAWMDDNHGETSRASGRPSGALVQTYRTDVPLVRTARARQRRASVKTEELGRTR